MKKEKKKLYFVQLLVCFSNIPANICPITFSAHTLVIFDPDYCKTEHFGNNENKRMSIIYYVRN